MKLGILQSNLESPCHTKYWGKVSQKFKFYHLKGFKKSDDNRLKSNFII